MKKSEKEQKIKNRLLEIIKNNGACRNSKETCIGCVFIGKNDCHLYELIGISFIKFNKIDLFINPLPLFDEIKDKAIEYYNKKWDFSEVIETLL